MTTLWFVIVVMMFAVYVVLDGFDLGAGILHLFIAKSDVERRTVLAAIGPLWDGNEVWFIAGGGVLVYAFPRVYAAAFSGYYLALMMALWLLILRGISIEVRSHQAEPLWRSFWDGVFAFSSTLLTIVLGAALGTVIRGVPLDETGYFAGPLFTDFRTGAHPGILDWYTILVGVFALVALAGHGATFLIFKTEGILQARARRLAMPLWIALVVLLVPVTAATAHLQPQLFAHLASRPWTGLLVVGITASLLAVFINLRRQAELPTFLASALFLVFMLGTAAAGYFPNCLISTVSPAYSLNMANASAGSLSLRVGLFWWPVALMIVVCYFFYLYHSFRGKVDLANGGYDH
jgi:cytochrome d ubiquinol oxidase subunit II